MSEAAIDVLMMVTYKGKPMPAESRTVFRDAKVTDSLAQGFNFGQCCELQSFGFAAGVASSLSRNKKDEEGDEAETDEAKKKKAGPRPGSAMETVQKQVRTFQKRHEAEFVDMQPVDFTRIMDSASTLLFNAMVGCETVDSIAVIKRKAAGILASGDTYLRMDFTKVLVTELAWKDNTHIVIETGSFIYRSLRMRYRPQNADGSLGTVIESNWTMTTGTK